MKKRNEVRKDTVCGIHFSQNFSFFFSFKFSYRNDMPTCQRKIKVYFSKFSSKLIFSEC